eukprot:13652927-Ditylum_brightwellii.AAC.1
MVIQPSLGLFMICNTVWTHGRVVLFINDQWTYTTPQSTPVLKIKGEDSEGHTITFVPHTEPLEVVGLLQAPDGNQRAQVATLVGKAYDWSKT